MDATGSKGGGHFNPVTTAIVESKAVSNLETYKGGHTGTGYHEWMEKLINATDQARPGMGTLLRNMCRFAVATKARDFGWEEFKKGQVSTGGRNTLQVQVEDSEEGQVIDLNEEVGWPKLEWNQVSADLYSVLVATLTGEYLELVLTERRNGIKGVP